MKNKGAKLNLTNKGGIVFALALVAVLVGIMFATSVIPVSAASATGTCTQTCIHNLTPTARNPTNVGINNNTRLTDSFGNSYSSSFSIRHSRNNHISVTYDVSNFDAFTGTIASASGRLECRAQIQMFADDVLVFTSNVFHPNGSTPPQAFNINLRNVSALRIQYSDIEGGNHRVYNNTPHVVTIFNGQFTRTHTLGSWVTVTEATCTVAGRREQRCTSCNNVVTTESIPVIAHTPGSWVTVREATCTEPGRREQHCTVAACGALVTHEAISALGHALSGEWVIRREPTCTQAGERVQYCTRINTAALTESIAALPHEPHGEWVVTREPTCTREGEEMRECYVCGGAAVTRSIRMLAHTPSGNWVVYEEATCNTPGRRVQYCTVSGSIAIDEVISAITGLDHVLAGERVSGNMFIPPVVTDYTCEVCGYDGGRTTSWAMVWLSPAIIAGLILAGIIFIKTKRAIKKGKKFICPYCFEEHLVSDVQFRCANLNCADVDDIEMTRYEGGNISTPLQRKRTFPAPASKNYDIPKFAKCPDCKRETSKAVCPSCHNSLPESSLTGEDMIISVVGSRDVGKSHYIGVIINELIERVAGRFAGVLTGFDDTMTRYEENFGRGLYVELTKLNLTQSSTVSTNRPLIFSLTIQQSSKIRKFTLVFFDTAGEDLNAFDTMNTVNRYICKSAGIIFLLDPMQIWAVRNQLTDEIVSRASSVAVQQATRPDDIMTRVSELIRNDKKMSSTAKINIPVAAVFSKFDAIVPLIPPGSTILDPSPHCDTGAFVMPDWHNVNNEIQSLLKTWGAMAFVQQLDLNYANFSYFAASALGLGNSPRNDGRIDRPRPHRIEDALLWILKENGVIDSKN